MYVCMYVYSVCMYVFQCNGCVKLPNFDLLIISLSLEEFLLSHIDVQLTLMQSHINGF